MHHFKICLPSLWQSEKWYIWLSYTLPEPETVLGLLDNSSSTSHLHLTILPPSYSYFNLYNIEVFRDNDSELVFDQNISLARDETDIFLWNLTAGTLYNFSVTTRTIWEESDIFSTEFVTCKTIIFLLFLLLSVGHGHLIVQNSNIT